MTTPVALDRSAPQAAGCTSWQHQENAAQLEAQDADLVSYLGTIPPGVTYFQWNGSIWKYVNNLDGSVSSEPDVPTGNTGIFLCTAMAPAPGWSTGKKLAVAAAVALVVVGATAAVVIHHNAKAKR